MVKERPILFSGPMVRAIQDDLKTQTRRIVKPQFNLIHAIYSDASILTNRLFQGDDQTIHCPYGTIGDILWVREAFYQRGSWEPKLGVDGKISISKVGRTRWIFVPIDNEIIFETSNTFKYITEFRKGRHAKDPQTITWHKRLARFMPRWASRITLEITEVRVHRLNDISEENARAEGVEASRTVEMKDGSPCYTTPFQMLWNQIHGCDAWNANPWVWAISFRKV